MDTRVDGRNPPAVQLSDVSKAYGRVHAVRGISLSVQRGEFIAVLGPSGCGKTTTLRIIAGLERADAGDVLIDGQRVNERPPYAREVGLMFQNYALFPHRTVQQNIEFGLKYRGVPRQQRVAMVRQALELVRLAGAEDRYPSQLSGGQQQRVALARSLVVRPRVLLLDEPLSNLDERLRDDMRGELKSIQRETGLTFIYVTHDQHEALTLSDRVIVMHDGLIEQSGAPHDVYERPRSQFVAHFMGKSNLLQAELRHPGEAVLHTGRIVRFHAEAANGHCPGDQILLLVHAENIRLGSAAGDGWNGSVMNVIYHGAVNQTRVRLDLGEELVATTPGKARFELGDPVSVDVDTGDWVILPPERVD